MQPSQDLVHLIDLALLTGDDSLTQPTDLLPGTSRWRGIIEQELEVADSGLLPDEQEERDAGNDARKQ